jgi:hypothetical protein
MNARSERYLRMLLDKGIAHEEGGCLIGAAARAGALALLSGQPQETSRGILIVLTMQLPHFLGLDSQLGGATIEEAHRMSEDMMELAVYLVERAVEVEQEGHMNEVNRLIGGM